MQSIWSKENMMPEIQRKPDPGAFFASAGKYSGSYEDDDPEIVIEKALAYVEVRDTSIPGMVEASQSGINDDIGSGRPTTQQKLVSTLGDRLKDAGDLCVQALKRAGFYDSVVKKLADVNIVSVDEKGSESAAKYAPSNGIGVRLAFICYNASEWRVNPGSR